MRCLQSNVRGKPEAPGLEQPTFNRHTKQSLLRCAAIPSHLLQGTSQQQQQLTEADQEALLRAKYGGLLKKKPLLPQDRKHFDSADWQLSKQGVPAPQPQLEPKLNPTAPPARRSSQLGDGQ